MFKMRNYSVFDIIGPIMIGPSSSHTAGAARLGKIARIIWGQEIKKVEFLLHGSFAETYKGHGTDRALVAGILGMEPCDERLKDSLDIAKKENIQIKFTPCDLGEVHPNTVKIIINEDSDSKFEVMGSSIGGGNIVVNEINGEQLEFTGEYATLIIKHQDVPGVVCKVTAVLYEERINIAFMKVYRYGKGETATMVFEIDNEVSQEVINKINSIKHVDSVKIISLIEKGDK